MPLEKTSLARMNSSRSFRNLCVKLRGSLDLRAHLATVGSVEYHSRDPSRFICPVRSQTIRSDYSEREGAILTPAIRSKSCIDSVSDNLRPPSTPTRSPNAPPKLAPDLTTTLCSGPSADTDTAMCMSGASRDPVDNVERCFEDSGIGCRQQ